MNNRMTNLNRTLEHVIALSQDSYEQMPWANREFYSNYLAQTFYYVRHSTRILALSAGRLDYENQQKIHLRFLKHLGEEANHEKLALNDLKFMGHTIDDFDELNTTRFFYETQYYKIEHQHPLALMGYILFLEVLAQNVCPPLSRKLADLHGKKSATFLLVHGEEDPEHVSEAKKLLETLDARAIDHITVNLEQSAYAFDHMMLEIRDVTTKKKVKKAA